MKSNETLFLYCSVVVASKELEEIRQMVIKQMEEGVVILPYYLTIVSPRVSDELEKIKTEIEEIKILRINPYNNQSEYSVSTKELRELLDKHISELKGENK